MHTGLLPKQNSAPHFKENCSTPLIKTTYQSMLVGQVAVFHPRPSLYLPEL